jgi:hypothetical protein
MNPKSDILLPTEAQPNPIVTQPVVTSPLTTSQIISIIGCEELKTVYDKAYINSLDSSSDAVDWEGIDAVFYTKFKECT